MSTQSPKLAALRRLFPHTQAQIYLNHAATGPLSRPVVRAVQRYLWQRHQGPIDNYAELEAIVQETRRLVAQLLSTSPDRIAFAPSTSAALGLLAQGLDWKPGDRIAIPACEFPANVFPFLNLQRKGVVVDFIPHRNGTFTVEDVARVLTPRTRLVTLSWVQFLSGFCADLSAIAALCHERGIWLSVDAIQGLGALPLNVEVSGVDFLASGTHKWLMGLQGLALCYVRPELQAVLHPPAGWLHGPVDWEHLTDYRLIFYSDARRYETGTLNQTALVALHAALRLHLAAGPAWCARRVLALQQRLGEGLEQLGLTRYGSADPAHASGIIGVQHPQAQALALALQRRHIVVSVRNGLLRFSPTYYNSMQEIDLTLEAIADFLGKRKRSRNAK